MMSIFITMTVNILSIYINFIYCSYFFHSEFDSHTWGDEIITPGLYIWSSDKLSNGVALLRQHPVTIWWTALATCAGLLTHSVELRPMETLPGTWQWSKQKFIMVSKTATKWYKTEIMIFIEASLTIRWFLYGIACSICIFQCQCTCCRWLGGIRDPRNPVLLLRVAD